MKFYERLETGRKCDSAVPICVRLDGRSFSKFTKGLKRPYDERLSKMMWEVTAYLVRETHALIGYTQSDEISLVYYYDPESPATPLFGGKFHKLTSLLAGEASAKFVSLLHHLPEKVGKIPTFDCRVWQVANKMEASNVILWRWFDARKNSISMLAQSQFSPKELHCKDTHMMREMLATKGIQWESYPNFFKWGSFWQRRTVKRPMTSEELLAIPEKHRPLENHLVTRTEIKMLEMPAFDNVANRVEVIFDSEAPVIETQEEKDLRAVSEVLSRHPGNLSLREAYNYLSGCVRIANGS
jgi:tRNA(His) 5'-end guanylyltransferase